jgi:hypothetical protein
MKAKIATAALCALALSGAFASSASAAVPIETWGLLPSTTQAGGHPDLQIAFTVKNSKIQEVENGLNTPCDCENARFLTVHAPQGLVGSPANLPTCTVAQLASLTCPVDSQVGAIEAAVSITPSFDPQPLIAAVYNMVPRAGEAGLLAFNGAGIEVFQSFGARTGSDYGLETKISVTSLFILRYADQILWGVPASPSHDVLRFPASSNRSALISWLCDAQSVPATPGLGDNTAPPIGPDSAAYPCGAVTGLPDALGASSNSPLTPFTENPTSCGVPLQSGLDVNGYDGSSQSASAPFPPTTGCDQLKFTPSLAAKPTTTSTDSPSGMDVDLSFPQPQSPTVPSPSEIRGTEMTLPPGFTVNSNAADGKSACTDAQAAFGTTDAAQCPETSKIGSLEIHTALLPGPLPGYLYLGQPLSGERYRVFLVADGFNIHVKLPGTIVPDEQTGQLSVIFKDLPETPFEDFTLHIFGSERGSLATPTRCGTYPVTTKFTPWDDALGDQTSTQYFTIDSGPNGTPCPSGPRPFNPTFDAGSLGNTAGAHSPFSLDIQRADGDQDLAGLTVKTPPGFTASLKGIPYCPQAAIDQLGNSLYSGLSEIASSACPKDSLIGTVTGGAGAGSKPFYANGKIYLAGPYKDAPLSILAVIPAVSGPYDLGNVAVRNALYVDSTTAQVTTVADPLPQIIGGIPLRTRSIRVNLDRNNFALNPTNCSRFSVDAALSGDEGASSSSSAPFQVANCANLPFGPQIAISLKGGTKRNGHPAFTSVLTYPQGNYANLAKAQVTLPPTMQLDQSHITAPCTRPQFAAHQCPDASIIGTATAYSPLLDQPLSGPVYLRTGSNPLPDLVLDLHGPSSLPITIDAVGKVDTVNARLRTTFETVPDAPLSKAVISLEGGGKGLLVNNTDICANRAPASAAFTGQNGRSVNRNVSLGLPCRSKARHKRHHKAHHHRHRRHNAKAVTR